MAGLTDIVAPFKLKLVKDLRANLKRKGVVFGPQESKLSAGIHAEITEGPDKLVFQLFMPGEGEWINKGRGPTKGGGTGVVRKNMEEWVARKGLVGRSDLYKRGTGTATERYDRAKKQLAFLISRKVHRKGFKATHFYDEVINDGRLDQLQRDIAEHIKKDVVIEIIG